MGRGGLARRAVAEDSVGRLNRTGHSSGARSNDIDKKGILAVVLLFSLGSCSPGQVSSVPTEPGPALSSQEAVAAAERFIHENGYTDAPALEIKDELDFESIERSGSRSELLDARRNSLHAEAIGVKSSKSGWGVAFHYVSHPNSCRVVSMHSDGSSMRVQHQGEICETWAGFEEPEAAKRQWKSPPAA